MTVLHTRPRQQRASNTQAMGIVQHAYRHSIQIIINYDTKLRSSVNRDFDFHPDILPGTLAQCLGRNVDANYANVERRLYIGVNHLTPAEYSDVLRTIYLFFASRVEPRYIALPPKITQAPQPF